MEFVRVLGSVAEADHVEELPEEESPRRGARQHLADSLVDLLDVRLGGIVTREQHDAVFPQLRRRCRPGLNRRGGERDGQYQWEGYACDHVPSDRLMLAVARPCVSGVFTVATRCFR